MISPFFSLKNDWNEIVFEDRHKNYGAYLLRRDYDQTLVRSFLVTFGSLLLLVASVTIAGYFRKEIVPRIPRQGDILITKPASPATPPTQTPKSKPPGSRSQGLPLAVGHPEDSAIQTEPGPGTPGPDTGSLPGPAGPLRGDSSAEAGPASQPEIKKNEIVDYADEYPEFPGGEDALHNFIRAHLNLERMQAGGGERTKIMVSFIIDPEGNVTEVQILSRNGYGLEDQTRNIFYKMPKWKAGRNHSQSVYVRLVMPIYVEVQ